MRPYVHLIENQNSIPNLEGVEVVDRGRAQAVASATLQQLRREDVAAAQAGSGWALNVSDAVGRIVFLIDLDRVVG